MNSFPRRRTDSVPHSLAELARFLDAPAPEEELEVHGVAPLSLAGPEQIGLLADGRYLEHVGESRAGALLVSRALTDRLNDPRRNRPHLVVDDAHQALATLLDRFHPEVLDDPEIHPTAVIGPDTRLGERTRIGPYAVLEAGVSVGSDTTIGAHVVVGAGSQVGDQVVLHPHAVLYPGTRIGSRSIVHSGACVGVDGFGYVASDAGGLRKVPHVGTCELEEDVEIGANTTIDRGSIGPSRVETGAKLDNLIQLGHNVVIGPHSMLAAQVGIAGSTRLGAGVLSGGQAGIGGHMSIGDGARLAAQAGVTGDVAPGVEVMGFPARPRREFLRMAAARARLPDLVKRVRRLEERVAELIGDDDDASPGAST